MLWEFCFIKNYNVFPINLHADFLSFALVITPIQFFIEPNRINVDPYLFYKSKDTPPILQSWKNEVVCF